MCYARGSAALSRLSILWGLAALATLLTAFVSNVWLFTWEPVRLPNSDQVTTITFKIGLWRVCPTVKRGNITTHLPSPSCSLVKYSTWDEVKHSDLGVWTTLDFTPNFISRMRLSTPFEAVSVFLMLLATMFAVIGHCNGDHKTLIACGLFILGDVANHRGAADPRDARRARALPRHHGAHDQRHPVVHGAARLALPPQPGDADQPPARGRPPHQVAPRPRTVRRQERILGDRPFRRPPRRLRPLPRRAALLRARRGGAGGAPGVAVGAPEGRKTEEEGWATRQDSNHTRDASRREFMRGFKLARNYMELISLWMNFYTCIFVVRRKSAS